MARMICRFLVGGFLMLGTGAFADSLSLINTLPQRPVFSFKTEGATQTRSVAPGQRISLAPGVFSGLGDKDIPLVAANVYYMARFGPTARLYRLSDDQVLVLNQSGRAVPFRLVGGQEVDGVLAVGGLALGEGPVVAEWDDGTLRTQELVVGTVYRLVLDSPAGVGTSVSLTPWD